MSEMSGSESSENLKMEQAVDSTTERITASIQGPVKPRRKYTTTPAKLEQLRKARAKAAEAKEKSKTPESEDADKLKEFITTAVAQAVQEQSIRPKNMPRQKVTAPVEKAIIPPAKAPTREDLLMRIIRGY